MRWAEVKKNEKTNVKMVVKLHRYYGDAEVTKSVMEVWMDGEGEPRMVCEARGVQGYPADLSAGGQLVEEISQSWRVQGHALEALYRGERVGVGEGGLTS